MTKKELNRQIKEKINLDSTFREYYNSLTEEEKELFKEKIHKHSEIVCSIKENFKTSLEEIDQSCLFELMAHLKNKGYTKTHGKKASSYATGRTFVYRIDNLHIGFIPYATKKGYHFYTMYLLEVPSNKGKIYAVLTTANVNDLINEPIIVYTAHFFDRYQERLGLPSSSRDKTIEHFIKKSHTLEVGSRSEGTRSMMYLEDGLALGEIIDNILLNKTFISDEEINSFQEESKEDLKSMSLTIQEQLEISNVKIKKYY